MNRMLGKYEILRTLGQGAMGEVFLARQPAVGRDVAIKTILQSAAHGPEAEDRFRREANAAGRLSHPNLVTIFDFEKDGDVLFLVMEFVQGEDLEDLITKKALSQARCLEVLAQVSDGLAYAHRHGIIHRDVKPANVRVIQDGKRLLAKVMDFGVARLDESSLTGTGIVMGTVSYMAPEYIRSGKATAQSDLFAVGVMLYECLAGCKPFAGDTTATVLFKIVSEEYEPIDPEAIHGISPSIREVLNRVLAKNPAERFQTGDDLAKALRACMDPTWSGTIEDATTRIGAKTAASNTAVSASAESKPTEIIPFAGHPTTLLPAARANKGRGGLYTGIAALGLILAAGGWWLLKPRKGAELTPVQPVSPAVASASPAASPIDSPAAQPQAPLASVVPGAQEGGSMPVPPAVASPIAPNKPLPQQPPKPVEETFEQKLAKSGARLEADPQGSATLLRGLVQAQPAHAEAQGLYLASLLKIRNATEFEQAFHGAKAAGVGIRALLGVAPFKEALKVESRAHRAKDGSNVLPPQVLAQVTEGL